MSEGVIELARTAAQIAGRARPEDVFGEIAAQLVELGAEGSRVYLLEPEKGRLRSIAGRGSLDLPSGEEAIAVGGEGVVARAAAGETVFETRRGKKGPRTLIAIPLHEDEQVIGVVAWSMPTPELPSGKERVVIQAIAGIFEAVVGTALLHQRREQESSESLRVALGTAPIGMCVVDLDLRFLQVNRAFAEMTGYSREELLDMSSRDLTFPDDRESTEEIVERVVRGEVKNPVYSKRYVRKDGQVIEVEIHGGLVLADDGSPLHFVAQIVDITDRRRAEREQEELLAWLHQEWSWLSTVIEQSPSGIVLLRGTERIIFNPMAEQLFGFHLEPDLGIGQLAGRIRWGDDGELATEEDLAAGRLWEPGAQQISIVRPDGTELPAVESSAPISQPNSQPNSRERYGSAGRVLIFQDITPLKDMERQREEWTSIVAHDLRQVVTVITSYTGLLARQAGADPISEKLRHILTNANHLSRMISDLVDSSRLDTDRLELQLELVDLGWLVRDVVERREATLGDHSVDLDIERHLPDVDIDSGRIEQVLDNLLSNAVKYSSPKSTIEIQVSRADHGLEVAVSNRGEGITSEELPHVFRRFQRSASASRTEGLGLGLYIAKGIVEAHGGRIRAESTPGETTTFRFELPLPPS
ncbi:PAS domain S-box protein [Vulgatibacter incomptus]|uniref:histidine kinase n=1 Tax=Vulgatibacter incomptus TaxID=1391653 RepID=A0A0K1PIU9_9BACT|nr:PAS domain S-box protein [Vulgatibacter incomptus]AKU93034.1 Two-component sensor histidine kinase [Vulgatibacter incomptus]